MKRRMYDDWGDRLCATYLIALCFFLVALVGTLTVMAFLTAPLYATLGTLGIIVFCGLCWWLSNWFGP